MYGRILRQFTLDTGVGQKEVAAALAFSPQRVNNYYRDIAEPPPEFLEKFRKKFNVDLKLLADKERKGTNGGQKIGAFKPIPVYDLEFIDDPNFFNHPEAVKYYVDAPMITDSFAIIRVAGEAMAPEFTSSDYVSLKKITDYNTIPFGHPFYIITAEQKLFRIVKPEDGRSFRLVATNPKYDDICIKKTDIKHLFQIMSKFTRLA